jgi:hypothetical protein
LRLRQLGKVFMGEGRAHRQLQLYPDFIRQQRGDMRSVPGVHRVLEWWMPPDRERMRLRFFQFWLSMGYGQMCHRLRHIVRGVREAVDVR